MPPIPSHPLPPTILEATDNFQEWISPPPALSYITVAAAVESGILGTENMASMEGMETGEDHGHRAPLLEDTFSNRWVEYSQMSNQVFKVCRKEIGWSCEEVPKDISDQQWQQWKLQSQVQICATCCL